MAGQPFRMVIERNVRVPMRDGLTLAAEIYRPDTAERLPVIVERTPYDRHWMPPGDPVNGIVVAEAGYAVVMVDCRGRFDSDGDFRPFLAEAEDGEDTIAWAAAQPWSNGRVGMMGGSYVGATQWLAAGRRPPALQAIAPYVTASDYHEGWVYQGGAFQLGFSLYWSLNPLALARLLSRQAAGETLDAEIAAVRAGIEDIGRLYRRRPLRGIDLMDRFAPWYDEWLAHPDRDAFWRAISPEERYESVAVPALHIGGWHDIFVEGTLRNYRGMRDRGATDAARDGQQLIVGPWSHGIMNGIFPERHFGMQSALGLQDPTAFHQRFYDRWLRGAADSAGAPVRLFLMGANEWRDETDWPILDAVVEEWHLRGDGRANSARGDGRLSRAPAGHESPDAFLADPRDPVPTIGGPTLNRGGGVGWMAGPFDQRPIEARADVLCYTSDPLTRPLDVIGSVEAVLHVASSALDTDITAKLIDVHPDGRAEILTDGILRLRYRRSLADPEPLEPGRVEEIHVLVGSTANRFLPGHRIRLDIAGSNFPRFDVNTNTAGVIASETADEAVPAINRVFHDSARPSRLLLPVVERA
ncbi:MAG: CocE/NonD family hydrolase [Chloroflexi bacterium]|nr:CocE/NonD family hydrolase [Chloroflexota bacterium]